MGISLKDFGSFAVGAINEDKKNTDKKFQIRKEELIANRKAIIDRKNKQYDSEIREFEEQNKKFKITSALNAKFGKDVNEEGKVIDGAAWGRDFLMQTNPAMVQQYLNLYKDQDPKLLKQAFADVAAREANIKPDGGTKTALLNKQISEIESIQSDFANKIKNAQGDSFLISKLIGDKNNKIATVKNKTNKGAEAAINLEKEVNSITKIDNSDTAESSTETTSLTSADTKQIEFAKVPDEIYISKTFKDAFKEQKSKAKEIDFSSPQYEKKFADTILTLVPDSNRRDFFEYDAKAKTFTAKSSIINADVTIQDLLVDSINGETVESIHKTTGNDTTKLNFGANERLDLVKNHMENYGKFFADGRVLTDGGSFKNLGKEPTSALIVPPQSIINLNTNTVDGFNTIYIPKTLRPAVGKIYQDLVIEAAKTQTEANGRSLEYNINAVQRGLRQDSNTPLGKNIKASILVGLKGVKNDNGSFAYPELNKKSVEAESKNAPDKVTDLPIDTTVPVNKMRVNVPGKGSATIADTTANRKKIIADGGSIIQSAQKQDITQEDGITNYDLKGMDRSTQAGTIRSATADAKRLGVINTKMNPKQRQEFNKEMRKRKQQEIEDRKNKERNADLNIKPIKSVG